MPETEAWTIGRLLEWTAKYLTDRGSDSPRLDAELLLATALGCPRIQLYTDFDRVPAEEQRGKFRELVRRRAEGTPVAYLLGHREFYSLDFRVTPDVLIPRPETEYLVIAAVDALKQRASAEPPRLADVGTGSGIIAICVAKQVPTAEITALDVSPAALEVARANAERHDVTGRITFIESDLFTNAPAGQQYDVIASNPPYITTSEMAELPIEVGQHEPHLALAAGVDGLDVIRPLIAAAAERLLPAGHLLMEVSPMIEPAVVEHLTSRGNWEVLSTIKDQAGHRRVVRARLKS